MSNFIEVRCPIESCPYGKKHCCFGEIDRESLGTREIVERHKCPYAKKSMGGKFVMITVAN